MDNRDTVYAVTGKRCNDDRFDVNLGVIAKKARIEISQIGPSITPVQHEKDSVDVVHEQMELKPYPYFYYRDFSFHGDPDPLTPLTAPGRVPNFPAKMHSILSRPDLADVVAWMPHGRSWRVLKPREFEIRVIPTYFDHVKFSSFIRQANCWGFRRVTEGPDRNSCYHELFLRGLPHLCKMMKRRGVSEQQVSKPEHEPDLYEISKDKPVPEKANDEFIALLGTLQGGPKARIPIHYGAARPVSLGSQKGASAPISVVTDNSSTVPRFQTSTQFQTLEMTPSDYHVLQSFEQSISASENQVCKSKFGFRERIDKIQEVGLAASAFIPTASITSGLTRSVKASEPNEPPSAAKKSLSVLAMANNLAMIPLSC